MKSENFVLVTTLLLCIQGTLPLATSVKTISDYAKVARNAEESSGESTRDNSTTTAEPVPENPDDTEIEYEDFDELQDQPKALNQPPSSSDFVKYFSGLISLLTLMYRYNGKINAPPLKTSNTKPVRDTGKAFAEASDRFDFPQKKFKKGGEQTSLSMDQQLQPLENYPPYNPLTANKAETYGDDDKKTSYDVYDGQTSLSGYKDAGMTYQMPKLVKQTAYDDESTWNLHPVYQSKDQPSVDLDSYHTINSWQPDTHQSDSGGYDSRQPWTGNLSPGYPVYNHDIDDHHHHYHDVEPPRPVDEDRVSKKPYSYYFLGRKLWYVPLLFSVYFIVYVGALVLKSVARHKIQFPEKVWNLHDDVYGHATHRQQRKIDQITQTYENAVDKIKNKFM